jgi:hypothetical protein
MRVTETNWRPSLLEGAPQAGAKYYGKTSRAVIVSTSVEPDKR